MPSSPQKVPFCVSLLMPHPSPRLPLEIGVTLFTGHRTCDRWGFTLYVQFRTLLDFLSVLSHCAAPTVSVTAVG